MARHRAARWVGFALGLCVPPLLVLTLARAVVAYWGGLDGGPVYGIAVVGTRDLAAALDRHRARYQRVPDAREGLAKLAPEFIPAVPYDPWGRPYIYEPSGPTWADVLSYGADGRAGGQGANADVSARFGRLGARPPSGYLNTLASLLFMGAAVGAALAAMRRPWAAGMLAGMSAFWGGLLLVMVGAFTTLLGPLALVLGVGALLGAIAVLRELPYARLVAFLAVVGAYLLVQFLVATRA